tara:strand:+ start:15164 stop:15994 length:831 start_codon:yes stop_codon:yes gene_type:complete
MKIIIIGIGGYVDAVVLPILKRNYKQLDISLLSHNPLKSHNIAEHLSCSVHDGSLEKYDYYFLNTPIWDYESFIKKIPLNKPLWLEKPIADISDNNLEIIRSLIEQRTASTHVGLNQRYINKLTSYKNNENIRGTFDFKVEFNPAMSCTDWKHSLVEGGIFYTDGIHAIDLALYILGEKSEITSAIISECDKWQFNVKSKKGEIQVNIGLVDESRYLINSENILVDEGKNRSQSMFRDAFYAFLNGESNFDSCYRNFVKIRDAITLNNLTSVYLIK